MGLTQTAKFISDINFIVLNGSIARPFQFQIAMITLLFPRQCPTLQPSQNKDGMLSDSPFKKGGFFIAETSLDPRDSSSKRKLRGTMTAIAPQPWNV